MSKGIQKNVNKKIRWKKNLESGRGRSLKKGIGSRNRKGKRKKYSINVLVNHEICQIANFNFTFRLRKIMKKTKNYIVQCIDENVQIWIHLFFCLREHRIEEIKGNQSLKI